MCIIHILNIGPFYSYNDYATCWMHSRSIIGVVLVQLLCGFLVVIALYFSVHNLLRLLYGSLSLHNDFAALG